MIVLHVTLLSGRRVMVLGQEIYPDMIIHRNNVDDYHEWRITDKISGAMIGYGSTRRACAKCAWSRMRGAMLKSNVSSVAELLAMHRAKLPFQTGA